MDAAPFAGLMHDEANMAKVYMAVEDAVVGSFEQDCRRTAIVTPGKIKQSEVKRRANICWHIFRVLRGDMDWSWMRIVDHIPRFLRMELDGQHWEPDTNGMWAPEALTD